MALDIDEMPKWLALAKNYSKEIIAGINDDDCAVIKIGSEQIVITTDYLNANPIALELKIGNYWNLGRLLVSVNLSDLCGTGALPKAFLTAIMLDKNKTTLEDFELFMNGVRHELNKWKIPLVGGDSKLGSSNTFCGIAIGQRERNSKLTLKNAAKDGDDIWVSGNLGSVAAAIEGLRLGTMNEQWNLWAKQSILEPKLPLKKSRKLAKAKFGNGGTDISDGLGADLWNLCESSNVGAIVDVSSIPVSKKVVELAKKKGIESWIYSLTIGGDCQFLFTANQKFSNKIKEIGFIKIGVITNSCEAYININNHSYIMPKLGHRDVNADSFAKEVNNLTTDISNHLTQKIKNDR